MDRQPSGAGLHVLQPVGHASREQEPIADAEVEVVGAHGQSAAATQHQHPLVVLLQVVDRQFDLAAQDLLHSRPGPCRQHHGELATVRDRLGPRQPPPPRSSHGRQPRAAPAGRDGAPAGGGAAQHQLVVKQPGREGGPAPYAGGVSTAYDVDREQLAVLLAGEPAYRVQQVWDGLYRRVVWPEAMTELPATLRAELGARLPAALRPSVERSADGGDTVKWLWELHDGALIETVLMRYPDRATVCVSTQAGCAMACQFCATGQGGFRRHLSVGEIVEQVARAVAAARPRRLSNVVLMGMGEPLANFDRVWPAVLRVVRDMGISARHVTVSTVGVVPGIRRLAATGVPVNLAVSLHAANDQRRDQLVPINRRYPLSTLVDACAEYVRRTSRRLSFEWALIADVNDGAADAVELAAIARPLGAHVNLIPLNPTPGYPVRGSQPDVVRGFRDRLLRLGVNATIRSTRGVEIDAACGQLAARGGSGTVRAAGRCEDVGAGEGPDTVEDVEAGMRSARGTGGPGDVGAGEGPDTVEDVEAGEGPHTVGDVEAGVRSACGTGGPGDGGAAGWRGAAASRPDGGTRPTLSVNAAPSVVALTGNPQRDHRLEEQDLVP